MAEESCYPSRTADGVPTGDPSYPGHGANETLKPLVMAAYGNLPLTFEPNQGQTDAQVKFLARGSGYTLFLTSNEAVLSLRKASAPKALHGVGGLAAKHKK